MRYSILSVFLVLFACAPESPPKVARALSDNVRETCAELVSEFGGDAGAPAEARKALEVCSKLDEALPAAE